MSDHHEFDFDPIDEDNLFVPPTFDCEWPTAWECDITAEAGPEIEAELLSMADEVPAPRASLRDEFLVELGRVERRRERLRQLPVLAAFLAAALLGLFGPSHESPDAGSAVASSDLQGSVMPLLHGVGPEELVAASREADSWALVDAYSDRRDRYREHFQASGRPPRQGSGQ